MVKTCTKCQTEKPIGEFRVCTRRNKRGGVDRFAHSWCTPCVRADNNARAKIKGYGKGRAYKRGRLAGKVAGVRKLWGKMPHIAPEDYKRKQWIAHRAVHNAVRSGVLAIGDCSVCGCAPTKKLASGPKRTKMRSTMHAHHIDYDRPLAVEWYCKSCHGAHAHGSMPADEGPEIDLPDPPVPLVAYSREVVWNSGFDDVDTDDRSATVRKMLAELRDSDDRGDQIAYRRLMGQTLQSIGDEIGLTKERVRQLEGYAFNRIRDKYGKALHEFGSGDDGQHDAADRGEAGGKSETDPGSGQVQRQAVALDEGASEDADAPVVTAIRQRVKAMWSDGVFDRLIAAQVGVSNCTISKFRNGHNPRGETLNKLKVWSNGWTEPMEAAC